MAALLGLLALLCVLAAPARAYTTDVLPNEEFCFKDSFDSGSKVSGGFHVVKGGNMMIDFFIYDANGKQLYDYVEKAEGSYGFTATRKGEYTFCIKNNYNVRKTVAFQYSAKNASTQLKEDEKNSALYNTINQIGSAVEFISKKQRFVLEKDARTMHTVKKTADKTGTWCLIELIAIGIIATVQIAFIFKVVQRKKIVGV